MRRLCATGVIHRRRERRRHGAKTRLRHRFQLQPPEAAADAFERETVRVYVGRTDNREGRGRLNRPRRDASGQRGG